jgi:hypothetical protein
MIAKARLRVATNVNTVFALSWILANDTGRVLMVGAAPRKTSNLFGMAALCLAVGTGAATLAIATTTLIAPSPAQANPTYAKNTKLACNKCHMGKPTATALTDFGMKFQANDHQVPK